MAEMVVYVDPRILKVHPRNAEFFDDVDGAEFDRLVESIKDHGVLTPLRITKDMTIISGHQRKRAAIKAERFSVPAIIDESDDDNDVLMKLIETNFGRMKNDPIKQAKWVEEYEKLKGVRQGSAERNNFAQRDVTQEDVAHELGVTVKSLQNLKSLLKLDPALQALISEGRINATTGFKILSKLTPEEQSKLVDKLPDGVKFSAKSIQDHIEDMRSSLVANTNKMMEDNNKLLGENEKLMRENNELRAGSLPEDSESRDKINQLEADKREFYEKWEASKKEITRMRGELDKAIQAKHYAEAQLKGGDEASVALENRISELEQQLEASERKNNDLAFQISEKEDEIKKLESEKRDGVLRKALSPKLGSKEFSERQKDALMSDISGAVGAFNGAVRGILTDTEAFEGLGKEVLRSLVEMTSDSMNLARQLMTALMLAGGTSDDVEIPQDDFDDDLDLTGLDCNLSA